MDFITEEIISRNKKDTTCTLALLRAFVGFSGSDPENRQAPAFAGLLANTLRSPPHALKQPVWRSGN
ncbi:MAG: hypothetical protein V1897_02945 [Pseudomonadota bacterium]